MILSVLWGASACAHVRAGGSERGARELDRKNVRVCVRDGGKERERECVCVVCV